MFICNECDTAFETPEIYKEHHGLDTLPFEELDACPHCHSTDIEDAYQCKVCGEWFEYQELSAEDDAVCEDCAIEIKDRWERVTNRIKQHYFNEAEREYLEVLEDL